MDDSDDDVAPYGTPLKPLEEDAPRKKPIGIEDQTVLDNQGRRRFHGAFSGGFSAGYYNTVGSKEGWTPSTFVSSRDKRPGHGQQRPEQYMDDEDLGEFGIAPRKITATDDFSVGESRQKKITSEIIPGLEALHELIVPAKIPMGVILLRKMGWKEEQGVGPKVKRKSKKGKDKKMYGCALPPEGDSSSSDEDIYAVGLFFAPKDVESFLFKPKDDTHGIGYRGIDPRTAILRGNIQEETSFDPTGKIHRKGISGKAFGVGAFEDDDDDIYAQDSMANYDIEIGGKDPTKNYGWTAPRHKKDSAQSDTRYQGKVIDGFHQSEKSRQANKIYTAPALPANFKPFHKFDSDQQPPVHSSLSSSRFSLSAAQRGAILGEEQLPGPSSVFDVMSAKDQEKVRSAAEKLKSGPVTSQPESSQSTPSTTTVVPPANKPLFTGAIGTFKPFAKDPAKQKRYEEYLEMKKSGRKGSDMVPSGSMTEWEREHEKEEFARAATLYQPLSNMMAARFTSAKYSDDTDMVEVSEQFEGDKNDQVKAADMKMYGKLTRDVLEWHPDRLLCKRFNVPDPYPQSTTVGLPKVKKDKLSVFNFLSTAWEQPSQQTVQQTAPSSQLALPAPVTTTPLNLFSNIPEQKQPPSASGTTSGIPASSHVKPPSFISHGIASQTDGASSDKVAVAIASHSSFEGSQATEKSATQPEEERPSMDLFKAIFEDSESENSSSEPSDDEERIGSPDVIDNSSIADDMQAKDDVSHLRSQNGNITDSSNLSTRTGISHQLSSIFGSEMLTSERASKNQETDSNDSSRKIAKSTEKEMEHSQPKTDKVNVYGPALPPTMQQGPSFPTMQHGTSFSTERKVAGDRTLYEGKTHSDRKRKHQEDDLQHRKQKHKHKGKEKDKHSKHKDKKKKSKKSKHKHKHSHKHKHKSRHKNAESDEDADVCSDSDSEEEKLDNAHLLQRLKSLPSHRRPTAADFM